MVRSAGLAVLGSELTRRGSPHADVVDREEVFANDAPSLCVGFVHVSRGRRRARHNVFSAFLLALFGGWRAPVRVGRCLQGTEVCGSRGSQGCSTVHKWCRTRIAVRQREGGNDIYLNSII